MIRKPKAASQGFSLVEVVLAIGIVSFSVLATVGLLSVGNDTNKRARDEGFAAQIAANEFQRIRSLGASVFPATIPTTLPARYFDADMKEVAAAANGIYELRIDLATAPPGTADAVVNAEVRYPAQSANPNIVRFTTLVRKPDP
jgi:uncharacterized protein (TIGR02598 family)